VMIEEAAVKADEALEQLLTIDIEADPKAAAACQREWLRYREMIDWIKGFADAGDEAVRVIRTETQMGR
jgi:hypothetical protein